MSTQNRFVAVPKKWKVSQGQILSRPGAMYFDSEEEIEEVPDTIEIWKIDAEDRLITRCPQPDFVPSAGTLDHFRALIDITRQLAEAANIPAALREKCQSVCENADQAIKREAGFAQAGGRVQREPGAARPLLGPAFTQATEETPDRRPGACDV